MKTFPQLTLCTLTGLLLIACGGTKTDQKTTQTMQVPQGTFGHDIAFLKQHKDVLVLTSPDNDSAQVAVIGDYQGRVMTSTASGSGGNSFGWINYKLIASGEHQPHMNAFGGEDRIWRSPEGGQFSVYFKPAAPFTFDEWQTPAIIDTTAYTLERSTGSEAVFSKAASLTNHAGVSFAIRIERKVSVFSKTALAGLFPDTDLTGVKVVGYETANTLENTGSDWQRDKGVLGIWILGMFTPSPQTTIIAPFTRTYSANLLLTDTYFGKVPADRLKVLEQAVLMRADGKHRSKIGLAGLSARPFAGSYDAGKGVLTIVQYDLSPTGDYLKSTWEHHKDPYGGDALNAYNDGPLADGSQLGPFYELESNSPVKALKKGEKLTHHHRTFHFEGSAEKLAPIAKTVLGIDLLKDLNW